MRESGFHEAEPTSKTTKADLMAAMRIIAKERSELAERSARRERVIRELGYLIDEMDGAAPLPRHILWVVTSRMLALCREGLSHTRPGA